MSKQYFENNEELAHDLNEYSIIVRDHELKFVTDSGVFSRGGLDFGSQVLLEALDFSILAEGGILDVGCGYGPIGITLARTYPECVVHMVDVNERAMSLAKQNAQNNRVDNVQVYASDGYDAVTKRDFQAVVTNPPIRAGKEVVHRFIGEAIDYLVPGGLLTIVIQKKQGAPSAKEKMMTVFGNVTEIERKKGYWILQSQKMA